MMKRKAKILFIQQHSFQYRILLGRRISSGESFWWIPGGSVEQDETDFQAGLRELDEELVLTKGYLHALDRYKLSGRIPNAIEYSSSNAHNVIFIVALSKATEELPSIKDEFEEVCWFDLNALPENMSREFQYIQKDFDMQVKAVI